MARSPVRDAPPESDRLGEAPHPRNVYGLAGHAAAERALLDAFRAQRLAQAWILGGPEGIGKATLAWRFARFLLANPDPTAPAVLSASDLSVATDHPAARRISALAHGDLTVLRRQWNEKTKRHYTEIRVDDVRETLNLFRFSSGEGGWRVCIIDCAEDLNRSSANALLKLIEEPPPRSLFLFIAHRPAQVLVTIRSRCRMLMLTPLVEDDTVRAIEALGRGVVDRPRQELAAAAAQSAGSVREALRLLDGDGLQFTGRVASMLAGLPKLDWRAAHAIADAVSSRENDDKFGALFVAWCDWLDARARAGGSPAVCLPFANAWDKITRESRDVESLNLDRRPFVLEAFSDLAEAARLSAEANR